MKLLLCARCADIIRLVVGEIRSCQCGATRGVYDEDGLHARYSGDPAIPLGIDNASLSMALLARPDSGVGREFEAFVIPRECETFVEVASFEEEGQ